MKKTSIVILLTLALMATHSIANAQYKWSAGCRTGISLEQLNLTSEYDFKPDNRVWINEAFINRSLGKRFELETSLQFSSKTFIDSASYFDGPEGLTVTKTNAKHLSIHLTARYYIIRKQQFSWYTQFGVSIFKPLVHVQQVQYFNNAPVQEYNDDSDRKWIPFNTVTIGTGSSYNLTKRIIASATLLCSYKTDGGLYMGQVTQYNDWSATLLFGLGYRF